MDGCMLFELTPRNDVLGKKKKKKLEMEDSMKENKKKLAADRD